MSTNKKFIIAKILLIFSALPIVMYAYEYGPDPFRTGAPGDRTCLDSGCHSGPALNAGGGSVKIVLPNGNTYTPGAKQRIMVQILDSAKQKFGFELTARLASNIQGAQAGELTSADTLTQVICADGAFKPASGCAAGAAIQFVEHTRGGYTASTAGGYTYQFDWTPPATNAGNVNLYVAANAGPGGNPVSTGANIYTTNVTLTPTAAATGPTLANVQDAESGRTTVVPGEWAAIYGQNLAGNSRAWAGPDFTNGNTLPTSLDGVSVTFNGLPAPVYYISPGQLDVQVPSGISGTVQVVVTSNGTASAAFNSTVVSNAPSLYNYPAGAKLYPAATHADNSLIGDPAALAGTTKAKPGESIVLYVNGLAPSPSGTILGAIAYTASAVTVNFGSVSATADYSGVAFAGGFQVNVRVPASLAPGDYALSVETLGQTSPAGITLPVGQ
ncbi:MAG: hypothetical protein QOJ99_4511 [Bryobacterales bacterium]|nr:hypothetical protein [Bryobacterales bacterium]